jgi:hypothetical protein
MAQRVHQLLLAQLERFGTCLAVPIRRLHHAIARIATLARTQLCPSVFAELSALSPAAPRSGQLHQIAARKYFQRRRKVWQSRVPLQRKSSPKVGSCKPLSWGRRCRSCGPRAGARPRAVPAPREQRLRRDRAPRRASRRHALRAGATGGMRLLLAPAASARYGRARTGKTNVAPSLRRTLRPPDRGHGLLLGKPDSSTPRCERREPGTTSPRSARTERRAISVHQAAAARQACGHLGVGGMIHVSC